MVRLNNLVALMRFSLRGAKMEAPSSTGASSASCWVGMVFQGERMVERPPT